MGILDFLFIEIPNGDGVANPALSAHLAPRELSLGEGQLVSGAVVQQVAGGKGHDVRVPVAPFPFTDVDACAVETTRSSLRVRADPQTHASTQYGNQYKQTKYVICFPPGIKRYKFNTAVWKVNTLNNSHRWTTHTMLKAP